MRDWECWATGEEATGVVSDAGYEEDTGGVTGGLWKDGWAGGVTGREEGIVMVSSADT